MPTVELLGVVVFGLLFFLIEEFRDTPAYSFLTLAVAGLVGAVLCRFAYRKEQPVLSWCLLGAITAALTAVLRPALVYGGYVSYLRGVDCFGRLGLDNISYLLFALSGVVAGGLISRLDPRGWLRVLPLLGIALGVLYHYKLAQGFWSPPLTMNGSVLLSAEFLGPTIYGWSLALLAASLGSVEAMPRGRIPGFANEFQRFLLALAAPVGITIMGAILGIEPMFIAGLVLSGLIVAAGILRYKMSQW